MKKLKWKPTQGLIARVGDMTAADPYSDLMFYSVYQGIELTTFFWYRTLPGEEVRATKCSSIKDGIKQAEVDFKERHK